MTKRSNNHPYLGPIFISVLLIFILGGVCMLLLHPRSEQPPFTEVLKQRNRFARASAAAGKPCLTYPHALVTCGIDSPERFEEVRESDPDLRVHYADVGFVRTAILKADEWDYVSFRQGSRIVWTPNPVPVRAGELVLTDRAGNSIRGRCGNRLSAVPRQPKAFVMPPELVHETADVVFPEAPLIASDTDTATLFPLPDFPDYEAPVPVAGLAFPPVMPPGPTAPASSPVSPQIPLVYPFPPLGTLRPGPYAPPIPPGLYSPPAQAPSSPLAPPVTGPVVPTGDIAAPEPGSSVLALLAAFAFGLARAPVLRKRIARPAGR